MPAPMQPARVGMEKRAAWELPFILKSQPLFVDISQES